MDRRIRGLLCLSGLCVTLGSAGCQGFHRRGIPPEPRMERGGGPARFHADPKPFPPTVSGPAQAQGLPGTAGPYGTGTPDDLMPAPPVGEPAGTNPNRMAPGPGGEDKGRTGMPGLAPGHP